MAEFVDETGVDVVEHIPDSDGVIWSRFNVTQQRTYVLINDDGTETKSGYGNLAAEVQALIER